MSKLSKKGVDVPTKNEMLSKIDRKYLRDIVLKVNNSPQYRFLGFNDIELTEFLAQKFDKGEVRAIYRSYIIGKNPKDIAEELRERGGGELAEKLVRELKGEFIGRREVKVKNRFCDLVLFNNKTKKLYAIEVKANGDTLSRAEIQCADYRKWAYLVYILIEEQKLDDAKKLPDYIGIFVVKNGVVCEERRAQENDISIENYLNLLTLQDLKNLGRKYRIKVSGRKVELKEKLSKLPRSDELLVDCKKALLT